MFLLETTSSTQAPDFSERAIPDIRLMPSNARMSGHYLVGAYLGIATLGGTQLRRSPSLTSTYLQVATAGDGNAMQVERLIVIDSPPVLVPLQIYAFPIRLYLVREGPVLTRVLCPGQPIYTVLSSFETAPLNLAPAESPPS